MSYRKPSFRASRLVPVIRTKNPVAIVKKLRENQIAVVVQGPTFNPFKGEFGAESTIKVHSDQSGRAKAIINALEVSS